MKVIAKISLTLLLIILFSCSSKEQGNKNFDYGSVEEQRYENNFFGFTLDIPENWTVLSEDANKNLMQSELDRQKSASQISTATLLTLLQFPLDATPDSLFNANLLIIAENLKNNNRVNNGADYLRLTQKALDVQSGLRTYLDKSAKTENINGWEFAEMNVSTTDGDLTYLQQYQTTILNGFALTIIKTYDSENQKALLDSIVSTISLN